jgi:hypothetical protein
MTNFILLLLMFQTQRPLPSLDQFLQATKAELMLQLDEDELLKGYVYRRKTSQDTLGRNGIPKGGEVAEHEVFQFDEGPYEKLVSRNGVPVRDGELQKQDEEHLTKGWTKDDSGPPFAPKSREDREAMIEDMFRVWRFQMVRREFIAGRPAVVIAFGPKKDAKPNTLAGRWMFKNSEGVVWVDEADHRIVRSRTVLINSVSLAWGLFGKVHKGTEIIREWRKINDEVWLPSRSQTRLRGRAFLVGFNFLKIEEYSDYRRFDVETKLEFGSPN